MRRNLWLRSLQILLIVALPILLIATNLRIATSHWYVRWEYGKATFPPDSYGLSASQRTYLAEVCVDYLATNADISLLANLRLPGGEPAFNERELRHMEDVQLVFARMVAAGIVAGVFLVGGLLVLSRHEHTRRLAPAVLLRGSLATLGLLVGTGVFMLVDWWEFFTAFHLVFFEGDTWLFYFSDTLIRLFPTRFWTDVATLIVALLVAEAVGVGCWGWIWRKRAGHTAATP